MAASCSSVDEAASDITTCSLCLGKFAEPKALPCIHTFCLQCLVSYCASQTPDQDVPCPLCSKAFTIPPGGIQNLPNNFFIHQLLNVTKPSSNITDEEESVKPLTCELCSDSHAEIPSTSYCVDCDQNICNRCSMIHKKAKVSKSHQIVLHSDISRQQKYVMSAIGYCDQHPSEQNRLYCYDCKSIMCLGCMDKHSQHKISDVNEAGNLFRHQLGKDIKILTTCINTQQTCRERLELDTEIFFKQVTSVEREILKKRDQLEALIQSYYEDLTEDIRQFKGKISDQVAAMKEDMERQSTIAENFKAVCFELWSKGTAYDVARTAHDLHVRAQELEKAEEASVFRKLSGANISLKPSLSSLVSVTNFTGELVLGKEADRTTKDDQFREQTEGQNRASIINLTAFLDNPTLLQVMSGSPGRKNVISGITVLGRELFLVRNTPQVDVYRTDDFSFVRYIKITGSKHLAGVVGCSHHNCLYFAEWDGDTVIYRYDLVNDIASNWSVGGRCCKVSLAKCHNVLVVIWSDPKRIQEYTTDGILVKEIVLDVGFDNPKHCVQLSTGDIAIGNCGVERRLCIVDYAGRIIYSCSGSTEVEAGELNGPIHLAVDADDNVLVADANVNDNSGFRIQLFSSTLTYLGDVEIAGHVLGIPFVTYFDALNRRLYFGVDAEWEGERLYVLGV